MNNNYSNPYNYSLFDDQTGLMYPTVTPDLKNDFTINLNTIKKTNYNEGYIITGSLYYPNFVKKLFVKYNASNPPNYNSSFSGSGLPYPNEEIAFENTPNKGIVEILNGDFKIKIKYPNSYYSNMRYVPPEIRLLIVDKDNNSLSDIMNINLGDGIPYRTLTMPNNKKNSNLDVKTQYEILMESAYPSH